MFINLYLSICSFSYRLYGAVVSVRKWESAGHGSINKHRAYVCISEFTLASWSIWKGKSNSR